MLLPDKHITLAESIIGLGAFVLGHLDTSQSIDRLYDLMKTEMQSGELPAFHDLDALLLSILFLYSIGAIDQTSTGGVKKCAL